MIDPSFEPSAPVPQLAASSGGLAASLGLCANARYQVIGGIDRYMFDRCSMLWVYLIVSSTYRLVTQVGGEKLRLHLQVCPPNLPFKLSTPRLPNSATLHLVIPCMIGLLHMATSKLLTSSRDRILYAD